MVVETTSPPYKAKNHHDRMQEDNGNIYEKHPF